LNLGLVFHVISLPSHYIKHMCTIEKADIPRSMQEVDIACLKVGIYVALQTKPMFTHCEKSVNKVNEWTRMTF